MKKGMGLATLVVAVILGQVSAVVCDPDSVPAPFRGGVNTTLQSWLFSTQDNPSSPDVMINQYGGAQIDLVLTDPVATLFWFPDDGGHQGIWQVDYTNMYMIATVQNNPAKNAFKDIWVQITYRSDDQGSYPYLAVFPNGDIDHESYSMNLVQKGLPDADGYYHAVYSARLPFNPSFEKIYIFPRYCLMFVDCITIETQCIPEPASLVLLGLGGLLLRKRVAGSRFSRIF